MENPNAVFYNTEALKKPSKLKRFFNFRLIFLVLGFIILGEVLWGVRVLTQNITQSSPTSDTSVEQIGPPMIILAAANKKYKIGDVVTVTIGITTGNNFTDGADVVLKFDQTVLESSPSNFTKGNIYSDYPFVKIDNNKGLVQISGIAALDKGFLGTGVFGKLNFKVKSKGVGKIDVVFDPEKTTDSNITESKTAKNILENTSNLVINAAD